MLLGDNVRLNEIMNFEKSLLVGRFDICRMGVISLKNWIDQNFNALLGYVSRSMTICKKMVNLVI